jgi:hypothetical protein
VVGLIEGHRAAEHLRVACSVGRLGIGEAQPTPCSGSPTRKRAMVCRLVIRPSLAKRCIGPSGIDSLARNCERPLPSTSSRSKARPSTR